MEETYLLVAPVADHINCINSNTAVLGLISDYCYIHSSLVIYGMQVDPYSETYGQE